MPDLATYPATPEGQAAFFEVLRAILLAVPNDHGLGFFLWEPGLLPGIPWRQVKRARRTATCRCWTSTATPSRP